MKEARKFTIGRDPRCDIAVADDSVSRVHAEFLCAADGSMTIRDRGSRNGTWVLRKGATRSVAQVEEVVYLTDTLQFGGASIAVDEILTGLRGRLPGAGSGAGGRVRDASVAETRMERCACGSVKPIHQRCPECHQ